jgi:hypothetical protein
LTYRQILIGNENLIFIKSVWELIVLVGDEILVMDSENRNEIDFFNKIQLANLRMA